MIDRPPVLPNCFKRRFGGGNVGSPPRRVCASQSIKSYKQLCVRKKAVDFRAAPSPKTWV